MIQPGFEDRDTGYKVERERLLALHDTSVAVGFSSEARYPDGTAVASVAIYLEYGTRDTRAYAFMRGTLDAFREEYGRVSEDLLTRVLQGRLTQAQADRQFAERVQHDIKQAILKADLVDSGRLVNSLQIVVER